MKNQVGIMIKTGILLGFCFQMALAAAIQGFVRNSISDEPVAMAQVRVESSTDTLLVFQPVFTDTAGFFRIDRLPAGIFQVAAVKDSFYADVVFSVPSTDRTSKAENVLIHLIPVDREWKGDYCFHIGSVDVVAKEHSLLPEADYESRKVNEGDLRHMQASSLGDILYLLPGSGGRNNPGLSASQRAVLRSTESEGIEGQIQSLGTAVQVDGQDMSAIGGVRTTDAMIGPDLREVSTENAGEVEVIEGLAPVEYGNYTNGLIRVKSRAPRLRNAFSARVNPDTKTLSWSQGFHLFGLPSEYLIDYGYSEKDPRIRGDEYHRLHGNLKVSDMENGNGSSLSLDFSRILNSDAPAGPFKLVDFDSGYRTSVNFISSVRNAENVSMEFQAILSLRNRDEHHEKYVAEPKLVTRDSSWTVDSPDGPVRMDTTLVDLLPGYIGSYDIRGQEWSAALKFRHTKPLKQFPGKTNLVWGAEAKLDINRGQGFIVNPEWSYYGVYSGRRSYPFDSYPGQLQITSFISLRGQLLHQAVSWNSGLRLDGFSPTDNVSSFRQGKVLQPRVSAVWKILPGLSLRSAAGRTVQNVTLAQIYSEPKYFEYLSDTVRVTEIYKQENRDLKYFPTDRLDIGLEFSPRSWMSCRLTAYSRSTEGLPIQVVYPAGFVQNPDTLTSNTCKVYENSAYSRQQGLEFRLVLHRSRAVRHYLDISYRTSVYGSQNLIYQHNYLAPFETLWYPAPETHRKDLHADYRISGISPELGMWVTLEWQADLMSSFRKIYATAMYYRNMDGEDIPWHEGMAVAWDDRRISYPALWKMNFRVTKSLGNNTDISLYINNVLDNRGLVIHPYSGAAREIYQPVFYGLEVGRIW